MGWYEYKIYTDKLEELSFIFNELIYLSDNFDIKRLDKFLINIIENYDFYILEDENSENSDGYSDLEDEYKLGIDILETDEYINMIEYINENFTKMYEKYILFINKIDSLTSIYLEDLKLGNVSIIKNFKSEYDAVIFNLELLEKKLSYIPKDNVVEKKGMFNINVLLITNNSIMYGIGYKFFKSYFNKNLHVVRKDTYDITYSDIKEFNNKINKIYLNVYSVFINTLVNGKAIKFNEKFQKDLKEKIKKYKEDSKNEEGKALEKQEGKDKKEKDEENKKEEKEKEKEKKEKEKKEKEEKEDRKREEDELKKQQKDHEEYLSVKSDTEKDIKKLETPPPKKVKKDVIKEDKEKKEEADVKPKVEPLKVKPDEPKVKPEEPKVEPPKVEPEIQEPVNDPNYDRVKKQLDNYRKFLQGQPQKIDLGLIGYGDNPIYIQHQVLFEKLYPDIKISGIQRLYSNNMPPAPLLLQPRPQSPQGQYLQNLPPQQFHGQPPQQFHGQPPQQFHGLPQQGPFFQPQGAFIQPPGFNPNIRLW